MKITRRQFVKGGVAAFTGHLRGARVSQRPGAGAGCAHAQSGGPLSGRRERLAQHADSVQRSVLLQPAAVDRRAGGQRPADRHRLVADRAGAASAPHRPEGDLRSRPSGVHSTDRLREPDALAFHRDRHLVHRRSAESTGSRLGRPLSRLAAVAGRSAGRVEYDRRVAARASGGARGGPGHRHPGHLRVLEPELRRRSGGRAGGGAADQCPRADRSARARVRLRQLAGGAWPRSIASHRSPHTRRRSPTRRPAWVRRFEAVSGAMAKGIGTRVFYVTIGGFDTHPRRT